MGLLAKHASETMKRRLLPGGCAGDIKFCFAITEPNAGSNSMEITTAAKADGKAVADLDEPRIVQRIGLGTLKFLKTLLKTRIIRIACRIH